MHKFPIVFYSFLFLIVTASKIRILDHDECKRIPNCDECDDDQCTECDDGFYLTSSFSCERCSQLNCESCPNNVCVKCHGHNILIGSSCQSKEMIPIEKRMKDCEHYALDFSCLKCDDDCSMKNGICLCDKDDDDDDDDDDDHTDHTAVIVISIVVSLAVVIGVIIGLCFYLKKRKQPEENNVVINLPNIPPSDEVNYDIMNEKGPANTVGNEIETQPIEVKRTISKTNTFERHSCMKCNKETAMYKLSCGCFLCRDDINDSIKRCPVCDRNFDNVKTIMHECGICMEVKEKANRFDCGCKFEICDQCAKKILISKTCPGCRKEITNIVKIKE